MKRIIFSVFIFTIISYCYYLRAESIPINSSSVNNHVCVVVNNLDKIVPFYRDVLGLRVVDSGMRTGKETEQAFGIPNAKFKICKAFSPNSHFYIEIIQFLTPKAEQPVKNPKTINLGFNHFGIEVTDVDKAYKIITASNGKAVSKPVTLSESGTKMFFARDPEGNRIEIFKRKQK
jgi:catechol 2,3-dioxygenase-like lactoylglutathione lyase family enzyme